MLCRSGPTQDSTRPSFRNPIPSGTITYLINSLAALRPAQSEFRRTSSVSDSTCCPSRRSDGRRQPPAKARYRPLEDPFRPASHIMPPPLQPVPELTTQKLVAVYRGMSYAHDSFPGPDRLRNGVRSSTIDSNDLKQASQAGPLVMSIGPLPETTFQAQQITEPWASGRNRSSPGRRSYNRSKSSVFKRDRYQYRLSASQ